MKKARLILSLLPAASLAIAGCSGSLSTTTAGGSTTSPVSHPAPAPTTSSAAPVTIISPSSGASVISPFALAATGSTCSSQNITSMGYSLDTSNSTIEASGTSLNAQVIAAAGAHTVNVTARGNNGAICTETVAIVVSQTAQLPSSNVPANAITVSAIQALPNWTAENDSAAIGASSGIMALVPSTSLSGNARQFLTSFSNSGNERYSVKFGSDMAAQNFFYDASIYIEGSNSNIANLEFDMNQLMPNGQTVIFGFQCDGYSSTWDYTGNVGTPTSPIDHWFESNQPCNPRNWTPNAWHHIQVSYSRDDSGNVTYKSVWLDGAESMINVTVPSAFALDWGPALVTNFQMDGLGSGSNTVYLDNVTISRW